MSDLPEIPGGGAPERRQAVLAAIETIVDPCSRTIGKPIGLASMGLIDRLDISGGVVSVLVLPTFPDCLFRGVFEEEIEKRLTALPWCTGVSVTFCPADQSWDESRLSPAARVKLGRKPAEKAVGAGASPER